MIEKHKWIILVTVLGGLLRLVNVDKPLWIDEALFGFWVKGVTVQEFPTVWLCRLFGLESDLGLRSLSIIGGTLTIPAVWWVLKRYKLEAALFVAVCPLFVFWSGMARPYAFAGLFMVIGWRYWWGYLIAIGTTPIALVGVRLWKQNIWVLSGMGLIAIGIFFLREDTGRGWNIENTIQSSRWYYLPILTSVLYLADYILPDKPKRKVLVKRGRV